MVEADEEEGAAETSGGHGNSERQVLPCLQVVQPLYFLCDSAAAAAQGTRAGQEGRGGEGEASARGAGSCDGRSIPA